MTIMKALRFMIAVKRRSLTTSAAPGETDDASDVAGPLQPAVGPSRTDCADDHKRAFRVEVALPANYAVQCRTLSEA